MAGSSVDDNLGAVDLTLSEAQLYCLSAAGAPSLGFPHDFLLQPAMRQGVSGGAWQRTESPTLPVA